MNSQLEIIHCDQYFVRAHPARLFTAGTEIFTLINHGHVTRVFYAKGLDNFISPASFLLFFQLVQISLKSDSKSVFFLPNITRSSPLQK